VVEVDAAGEDRHEEAECVGDENDANRLFIEYSTVFKLLLTGDGPPPF